MKEVENDYMAPLPADSQPDTSIPSAQKKVYLYTSTQELTVKDGHPRRSLPHGQIGQGQLQ